jgi:hypothetical protein
MLTEKQLNSVRKFFEDKTFTYDGEILSAVPTKAEFDFKIKIGDYRKMMSVGEYYDYLQIELTITKLKNNLSKLVLGSQFGNYTEIFKNHLYFLYSKLESYISEKLKYFDPDIRIVFNKFEVTDTDTEIMKENRISRIAIRTVVKDILTIIKEEKAGEYHLPDENGGEYSFINLPFSFSVELHLISDEDVDKFFIDGNWYRQEDVLEIIMSYNPSKLRENLYDIIGELNEVIAHELTHGKQNFRNDVSEPDDNLSPFEYYSQNKEIEAQRNGFKRFAKLRKEPYELVVRNWFKKHKDIHMLNDKETEEIIKLLL